MTSLRTPNWMQGCILFILFALPALGQTTNHQAVVEYVKQRFLLAQKAFNAQPDEATNDTWLARASFNWAELVSHTDQQAKIAQAGVDASRHLLSKSPQSAVGHYYLAMNYGELADAEAPSLVAYHLIREIEREFKKAEELDERLDFAGPVRCLGLLYRDAPGWPISIGSKRKAKEFLERAAALAPDFPENQMNLLETYIRWREESAAEMAWRKLASIWPAAQTNLIGMAWAQDWDDWTSRRAAAKADFEKEFKHAPSP